MVRWRYALVLAMLLLMPERTGSKLDDDDSDEDRSDESEGEDDGDEEDDDDDNSSNKEDRVTMSRQHIAPTAKTLTTTKSVKKLPLECFVCAYKADTPIRACLDPTKYRVHTITCHSTEDKCFTSVTAKGGSSYEAVVRGCRSGCIGSPETTCCELNRCNNQQFAMPAIAPRSLKSSNKTNKSIPPTIMFFVTVLLVLQTVVKVAFV